MSNGTREESDFQASTEAVIVSVDRPLAAIQTFFAECLKFAKRVKVVYYSTMAKQGFYVKILDENGKPKLQTHPVTGVPIMSGAKYQYQEQYESFDPIIRARTSKVDCLCIKQVISDEKGAFTLYQQELISKLERLSDDPKTYICRESEHKQKVNPEAWATEQKLKTLEKENAMLKKGMEEGVSKAVETIQHEAAEEIKRLKDKYEADLAALKETKKADAGGKKKKG